MFKKPRDTQEIIGDIKKFYVSHSMANLGNTSVKKGLQTIALCLLSLESKPDEPFVLRDLRNMVYDLSKAMNQEEKKLMKELLKLLK